MASSISMARIAGLSTARKVSVLGAASLVATVGLIAAPSAQAVVTPACSTVSSTVSVNCTIEAGETVLFVISSAPGGAGGLAGNGSGLGGLGGAGRSVSGTYTNTSGSVQTLSAAIGLAGAAGAAGATGQPGSAGLLGGQSLLFNSSASAVIALVTGGTGGLGGNGNTNGTWGTSGSLATPASLPSGWTSTTTYTPQVVFYPVAPSSSGSGEGPAPIIQEFGKPRTGTCDANQPAGLNWGGITNGGWGQSWSQWMNNGTGGFVCSRSLVYSDIQGQWVVA